jgi:hypothetical protein
LLAGFENVLDAMVGGASVDIGFRQLHSSGQRSATSDDAPGTLEPDKVSLDEPADNWH